MPKTTKTLWAIIKLFKNRDVQVRQDVLFGITMGVLGLAGALAGPVMLKMAIDALSLSPVETTSAAIFAVLFSLLWALSAMIETMELAFTDRIINLVAKHILKRVTRSQIAELAMDSSITAGHVQGVLERLHYSLHMIIAGVLWRVLPLIVQVMGAAVLVALLMPAKFAFAMAIILTIFFIFSFFSANQYERSAEVTNAVAARLSAHLGDVLNNAQRVMFNGTLQQETDHLSKAAMERVTVGWTRSWLLTKAALHQYGILAIGIGALFLLGVYDVSGGQITVGDFVLLQAYVFQFALPLGPFAFVLRQSGVALANVQEALDLIADQVPAEPKRQRSLSGPALVEISNLVFKRDNDFQLADINLTLSPGSFTAVVGANGSGKSTLMKLMAGVLSPSEGTIQIGGINIQEISVEERYKHALYVPQSVSLFDRTFRENVCYYPCQLTEEEVISGLEELNFYENAPIDLDQNVGASGGQLSGGQVQKLELVRISGVDSPVIVLDETTSGLDVQSDIEAIEMLRRRTSSRSTLVLITHRLPNVEKADLVVFMQAGRVIATGSHNDLMADFPAYREFWTTASDSKAWETHEEALIKHDRCLVSM